jgi:putative PIG3 family NAD(P)H quinone oxidoreductase
MKAIVVENPGKEAVLRLADVEPPALGPEDVRIRVAATAVNRADLMQARGLYPPPPGASSILGLECSGEVLEIGPRAGNRFRPGDRVMALLPGGGYAEEAVAHHGSVMRVPASLDPITAGGLPEVYLTVSSNVFWLGRFAPGQIALVHGGGSGVGTAAIQMIREAGGRVIVTAGSEEKCRRCVDLGAEAAIDYKREEFPQRVLELTGGRGVDVILDPIGGSYLEGNLGCLAVGGRLVVIGLTGGARATIDLAVLMIKRQQVIGSTLRARPVEEKEVIVEGFEETFWPAVEAGRLQPVVHRVLPLAQAGEAHRIVAASEHFGKVILAVRPAA